MLRALRKAAVTVGLQKQDDQDVNDKKRLVDLKDHNEAAKRNLAAYVKSVQDSYTHALSLYESMAVVYPAGQEMSAKLDTLASKAEFFKGVKEQIEAARLAVEGAITEVANKHKDLAKKADDRASHRQDIKHYEEKLSGLAEKAKTNPKEKERLEENEKKLEDSKKKFADADATLVPELEKLDSDIAAAVSAAFREFVEAQAKLADATAALYREALAATESPAPVAEEAK